MGIKIKFKEAMQMFNTFTKEPIYVDDIVVYLRNERTGSSTIRKCKFIGQVVGFAKTKIEIRRLSRPDIFVTPEECEDLGVDTIRPDDVVHVIISQYELDHTIGVPCKIGNVTFWTKKELLKWIEDKQNE